MRQDGVQAHLSWTLKGLAGWQAGRGAVSGKEAHCSGAMGQDGDRHCFDL